MLIIYILQTNKYTQFYSNIKIYNKFFYTYDGSIVFHNKYKQIVMLINLVFSKKIVTVIKLNKIQKDVFKFENTIVAECNKSCDYACKSRKLNCRVDLFYMINDCKVLRKIFNCKYCAAHVQ